MSIEAVKSMKAITSVFASKTLQDGTVEYSVPENIRNAVQELLDNWDVVASDVASAISAISTDYRVKFEEENADEAQSEDAEGAQIEQHIKASYEFSQFHRASSQVKFFFSRIPKSEFYTDENGNRAVRIVNSEIGLPEYMDSGYVFNSVLNACHGVRSKSELIETLKDLSEKEPMYHYIYTRLQKISQHAERHINAS